MAEISDHPLRYALVNELHARPFPSLTVPCHAVYVAIKEPERAVNRDRAADRAHLLALLGRHGSAHPHPDATHFSGPIGRHDLKWESHTEFVTYSAFGAGVSPRAFDPAEADVFPADWLGQAPGQRLTSVLIRVEEMPQDAEMLALLDQWFVPESLAISRIVDGAGVIAGDFRIDPAGHMRFAVFVEKGTDPRRVGRIVQRVCEIETYRAMSMLGLMRARTLGAELNRLDPQLSDLIAGMNAVGPSAEEVLHRLLQISAEVERLAVQFSFRFGATEAYEAIVNQRIAVLREVRIGGRQSFGEFMTRRYDPAMRTVKSTEARLRSMAERATRAAELLRTRVDVERSAQNQRLLESMDARADLQLRLQTTVEGLSVVAISYYAVNLLAYVAYPVTQGLGISKGFAMAVMVPVVILGVWAMVQRIKRRFH
ncbi:DUF3422 family protein [Pseudorhodobacter sp.]|uniref:DUF3422 family protein n=1 Tax=Pseudorhodobacter sp. TaxID=1934400 RepID=UPI002648DAA9|nr:DUF3422 domain-containing protein [Pseudorhodobacter sp.]MDN5789087.1 DUF3422 domain-containing protein [Pseudorhodobacter sp.]